MTGVQTCALPIYSVTPVEGTEVCAVLADTESYTLGADAATKAGQVWGGTLGTWNTYTDTEFFQPNFRYVSHYDNEPAPALVLCVSWKDAEGNLYYDEYPVQESLEKLADIMRVAIYGEPEEPAEPAKLTIDGKQYAFDWEMMGIPVRLDLGVSIPGYCMIGYDMEIMYGPEAAGMWMAYIEGYYELEETSETTGKIWLMGADPVTGDLARNMYIEYSGLTETEVTLDCETFSILGARALYCPENVTMMSQGIGGW